MGENREIGNQLKNISKLLETINDLKFEIVQVKIEAGVADEEMETWEKRIDDQIKPYEEAIIQLNDCSERIVQAAKENQQREDQQQMERQVKVKWDAEKEVERREERAAPKWSAKLPKLTIAQFNGSHLNWQRFFNQFDAEIDNSSSDKVQLFEGIPETISEAVG